MQRARYTLPQLVAGVSILTRAFARVQLAGTLGEISRYTVSILTRAFARVQQLKSYALLEVPIKFQSSLELSPECNGFILVCVLDGVQEGVCANPSESASDAGWRGVKQIRVFNVP